MFVLVLVPDILPWDFHGFIKRILNVYDIVTADYLKISLKLEVSGGDEGT